MKQRILHLLIAIDQLIYVLITLGAGYPDETLSSAAYRLELKGSSSGKFFRPKIDFLMQWMETEHCKKAYMSELRRLQVHKSMR